MEDDGVPPPGLEAAGSFPLGSRRIKPAPLVPLSIKDGVRRTLTAQRVIEAEKIEPEANFVRVIQRVIADGGIVKLSKFSVDSDPRSCGSVRPKRSQWAWV